MKFCEKCHNLYTLFENKDLKKIFYRCIDCNIKKEYTNKLLYDKIYDKKKEVQENVNKKYLKYDPSYPSINNDCPKCNNIENIYYKNNNMNIINFCKKCNYEWKN